MPAALKTLRRACTRGRKNGTARTKGAERPSDSSKDRDRTTCIVSNLHLQRIDFGRSLLTMSGQEMISRDSFIGQAVDELLQRLLRENPAFKLPPSCAFTA